METKLKISIANLKNLNKRDVRLGTREETLKFFQKIQRIIAGAHNVSCNIDSRETSLSLAMYYYRNQEVYPIVSYFEKTDFPPMITTYQWKKEVFNSLTSFISNIELYEQSE